MRFAQNKSSSAYYNSYNVGLRKYLVSVYNNMACALAITGLVAFFVANIPSLIAFIYQTPLHWVVTFAPLIYVFVFSSKFPTLSYESARFAFWGFAFVMGISLSWVFLAYTATSIARVFFISGSMFGAMAFYGNTTNKDLTGLGSFLMMGVVGLIIASIVNLFMHSTPLQFAISVLGVVIFSGLTAFDAQKIKDIYFQIGNTNSNAVGKVAIFGALRLFLDFINIFISLLQILGNRR